MFIAVTNLYVQASLLMTPRETQTCVAQRSLDQPSGTMGREDPPLYLRGSRRPLTRQSRVSLPRAYRWGEEGMAGVVTREQALEAGKMIRLEYRDDRGVMTGKKR
jgi:hypothetical protein